MEIAGLIITGIGAAASLMVFVQIFQMRKQMKNEYEKARREKTAEWMNNWCNSVKKATISAESIAQTFDENQCRALYRRDAFSVNKKTGKKICEMCSLDKHIQCENCSLQEDGTTVDSAILDELRWHVVSYLNTLETLMVAWDLAIVDRQTIEEQYQFLYDPSRGNNAIEKFRYAAGGYPTIEKFMQTIRPKVDAPHAPIR